MLRPLLPFAVGALLSLPAAQVMAIGFGRIANLTVLGQPLNFTVGVRLDSDDNLVAECISAEVFSGDNRLPSAAVRVTVEPGSDSAERSLRIVSSALIDEPVVSVNLQIACPNRLGRKFIAFVDPPLITTALPAAGVAGPEPKAVRRPQVLAAATQAVDGPATAPTVAAKPPPKARRAASAHVGGTGGSGAAASAPVARAPRPVAASTKAAAATVAARGARLRLEAADDDSARQQLDLRLTSTLAPAAAASGPGGAASAPLDEQVAQRARERERLLALEDNLTRLRAESQATKASLAQLQLRLTEAQAARDSNPLVTALSALVAVLVSALGYLLWRRRADRLAASQWWSRPAEASARVPLAGGDDSGFDRPDADARLMPRRMAADEAPAVETTASPMLLSQLQVTQAAADAAVPAVEQPQELAVEELIDLEQQAEFFVVLGQDEAAIDLLTGHLRSSGGASPLPYLKLLEIHRRRDEREAYERIRERFNRRFNAYAQDWQTDLQHGRTLLDYPHVIARLQSLWATPRLAMQALEASLFRRDAGSSTFDLPAYRELLFLYAVARDLSERNAAPASVDLLLPIGGEPVEAQPLTRLHPTPVSGAVMEHPTVVDVDITCLDAGPAGHDDRPSRFHTDFGPTSGYLGLPIAAPRASV